MIDEELLELAAKAAGSDFSSKLIPEVQGKRKGPFILKGSRWVQWNPLIDDGDALRLAVKLRIGIEVNECSVIACWVDGGYETKDVYEYPDSVQDDDFDIVHVNHDKAARRAIVRAAAEIGRSKQ